MIKSAIIATAFLSLTAVASAQEYAKFNGCPYRSIEGCILIRGPNGQIYNISAANPLPRIGYLGILGGGKVTDHVSFCLQGRVLENIKYHYTRLRCKAS
jgi:hypothetical protein